MLKAKNPPKRNKDADEIFKRFGIKFISENPEEMANVLDVLMGRSKVRVNLTKGILISYVQNNYTTEDVKRLIENFIQFSEKFTVGGDCITPNSSFKGMIHIVTDTTLERVVKYIVSGHTNLPVNELNSRELLTHYSNYIMEN